MPLNTLRLNHAPSSHPNDRIVFIKPLPRPPTQTSDYETADTLLRAIAAQCLPIMKSHYLSVTTLEEHEPNPEFIGRNFNNGEIIQLVLRGKNGGWLPVNTIQMVMMHELAHNVHMNHSRNFWTTRNTFAEEMKALWAKGYTGEGFWGGGRTLTELENAMGDNVLRSEELKDLQVCGGTFRSRRRKRKAGKGNDGLTWREKQQRRIEKKFGKNGVALGEDEDKRLSLELQGKGPMGVKPRVAQSKRGRELRAAAALARFDTNKKEVEDLDSVKREDDDTQSEDGEEYEDGDAGLEDAIDTDGSRLLDSRGQGMIRICKDEDEDDDYVKKEMAELESLDCSIPIVAPGEETHSSPNRAKPASKANGTFKSLYDIPQHQDEPSPTSSRTQSKSNNIIKSKTKITVHKAQPSKDIPTTPVPSTPSTAPPPPSQRTTTTLHPPVSRPRTVSCPICSLESSSLNPTCQACAHVLDRRKDPRAWKCMGEACEKSEYVNAGDMGVCGICGQRRRNLE